MLPRLECGQRPIVGQMLAHELAKQSLVRAYFLSVDDRMRFAAQPVAQRGARRGRQRSATARQMRATSAQHAARRMAECRRRLVVNLRVDTDVVRVCEDTRRPLRGQAGVWRQEARVVRAADGGERLRAEVTTPAVEADCDGSRPSV